MEILITKNLDNTLNKYKIWWEIYNGKKRLGILIYFIIGIAYLLISFISRDNNETFWNISSTIGFAFVFSAVIYFVNHLRVRKAFLNQIVLTSARNGQTIITEQGIFYKDEFSQAETKWAYYTHYKIHKNTLFLIRNHDLASSLLFNNLDMTEEDYSMLKKFVQENTQPSPI